MVYGDKRPSRKLDNDEQSTMNFEGKLLLRHQTLSPQPPEQITI